MATITMVARPKCKLPPLIMNKLIAAKDSTYACPDIGCGATYVVVWLAQVSGPVLPFWSCTKAPAGSTTGTIITIGVGVGL